MNRRLLLKRPLAIETNKLVKAYDRDGRPIEPWEEVFYLRPGDVIELTPSRAEQFLSAYPEHFDTVGVEIGTFLEQCCQEAKGETTAFKALYGAYREWCSNRGQTPVSEKAFGSTLGKLGYRRVRWGGGIRYQGLRLQEYEEK